MNTPPRTVPYGPDPSQFIEAQVPQEITHGVAVLIHGGWWRSRHDLRLMDALAGDLVSEGWSVWNMEFRRTEGTGGGWPATLDDVTRALSVVERVPGKPTVSIGHSAGGQLALMSDRPVDAVVALAPITDLARCREEGLGEGATDLFMGDATPLAYKLGSPIHSTRAGPKVLVVHGTDDQRVPIQHSRDYVNTALRHGRSVELLEVEHGDHFCVIDPSDNCWVEARRWMTSTAR